MMVKERRNGSERKRRWKSRCKYEEWVEKEGGERKNVKVGKRSNGGKKRKGNNSEKKGMGV